ncbi:hypothetical protein NBRC10513_005452 [Rhodotorula toruloides]
MEEGTVEVLSKISVFRWDIAIRTLQTGIEKAQTDAAMQTLYSPCFEDDWYIQLQFYTSSAIPESNGYCGVFLRMMDELSPPPLVSFSAEVGRVSSDPQQFITNTEPKVRERLFTLDRPACGWRAVIPLSWLKTQDPKDTLQVTLEMTEGARVEPALVPQCFFDNFQRCDVAFTFANCGEPLLALKAVLTQRSPYFSSLFAYEFSETSANYVVDLDAQIKRSKRCQGDPDELPEFETREAAALRKESRAAAQRLSSVLGWPLPSRIQASAAIVLEYKAEALKAKETVAAELDVLLGEVPRSKKWYRVQVEGCSWLTFSAFIWWLYYSEVRFAPSRAAVLGALDLNPDVDVENNMPPHWEVLALDRTGPPYACDPHALYRLADRYLEVRLREIAAYEAFSLLSRTFEDVQDGVVDYILKHINEVIKSPGWLRALELIDAGSLPGGAAILSKILSSRSGKDEAASEENSSKEAVKA